MGIIKNFTDPGTTTSSGQYIDSLAVAQKGEVTYLGTGIKSPYITRGFPVQKKQKFQDKVVEDSKWVIL